MSRKTTKSPKGKLNETIDFSQIGGLNNHLKTLREIIILPLLHSNVFDFFDIRAPRGVLFYGPPGTGKTLVAGALATELNKEGFGKVHFYHRKSVDIVEKYLGESEKNLRELFEKASKNRPSIIFFDEIDGLAPIRSQKNDQIYSSIVATLLALMDGLDNKPGIVVMGATNRIEAVDQALRRPGRFDRELYFPLPTMEGRKEIIQVHTSTWKHQPSRELIDHIADATSGFCGSDIAALCSEAVLCCMKRICPNIESRRKKTIDLDSLKVVESDFMDAKQKILPSGSRFGGRIRTLNSIVKPLMQKQLDNILTIIKHMWPYFLDENFKYNIGNERYAGRLLLIGSNNEGLPYLISALIQTFEHLPAQVLDLPTFLERNRFLQANYPSLIVLQRVDEWLSQVNEYEQHIISFLVSNLEKLHNNLPILTIATCKKNLPRKLYDFFYKKVSIGIGIRHSSNEERETFFVPLFFDSNMSSLCTILDQEHSKIVMNSDELNPLNENGKRRCEIENMEVVNKRIKTCENMYSVVTSHSSSSGILPKIDKEIKKEHIDQFDCKTGLYKKSKKHFNSILADLLCEKSRSLIISKTCPDNGNSSKEPETSTIENPTPESYEKNMKKIYCLWKRIALVTSNNMSVTELELLYDIISVCINMYQHSFNQLVEKIEEVVVKIEQ